MYNTTYLLEALNSFILSAKDKLSAHELQLLNDIRDCITNEQDQDKIEKGYFDLVKWLILLKDFFDNL